MEIDKITPDTLLEKLNELCTHLIDEEDYTSSSLAEKFKKELEVYFEIQRGYKI